MRSRLLGAVTLGGAVIVLVGACSDDDPSSQDSTLPPILTTTSTSTTIASAATAAQPQFYEVQEGDTLTEIADAYRLPIPAIMRLNGITDPNSIYAGQILELPNAADIVANSLPSRQSTSPSGPSSPGTTAVP